MSYVEDTLLFNSLSNSKIKCKCGHVITMTNLIDKKICGWCGNYVYRTKKIEFIEKLKKRGLTVNDRK